jgi:hypothetical protein|tara:strand:+ start:153 stop:458 length:306 start_codon:yes stop_codon:yes gene_type:complete
MNTSNDMELYHSKSETQMCWAFARASRRVELDVRMIAVPSEYKFWLYIALPEHANEKAQEQFSSIKEELQTGYEYSTLKAFDSSADKTATARKLFNIPKPA